MVYDQVQASAHACVTGRVERPACQHSQCCESHAHGEDTFGPSAWAHNLQCVQDTSARLLDASSAEPIASVPPQLSTHGITDLAVDCLGCKLYVLLTSCEIHSWRLSRGSPAALADVWQQHRLEKLSCIRFLPAGTFPNACAVSLGLCSEEDAAPDLLAAGTELGDLLFMLASSGQLVMRLCAHKLTSISSIISDAGAHRLLTTTDTGIKLWGLQRGMKMLRATGMASSVTCATLLGDNFVLGTAAGSVWFLQRSDGAEQATSGLMHKARVTSVQANDRLRHVVSASVDGCVKVWSAMGQLACTLLIGRSVACACFLDDSGNLACGAGSELLRVRHSMFDTVTDVEHDEQEGSKCAPWLPAHGMHCGA